MKFQTKEKLIEDYEDLMQIENMNFYTYIYNG
jgi:hypothetical protein